MTRRSFVGLLALAAVAPSKAQTEAMKLVKYQRNGATFTFQFVALTKTSLCGFDFEYFCGRQRVSQPKRFKALQLIPGDTTEIALKVEADCGIDGVKCTPIYGLIA